MNRHDSKKLPRLLPMLIALVCLFCALSGTASAAETVIAVGVTYAVGDTVVMPGETWFLEDDSPATPKDRDAGSYPVLEVTKNNPTYSQGKIQLQGEAFFGTYPIDIYVTKPADKKADDPIGFRIKSGSGTEADPYAFEFVYDSAAPTTFTVSFNSNGAASSKSPETGVSGSYTLPSNPFSWPGNDPHDFLGWRVDSADSGTIYQPGDVIQVTANVTLYAQWQKRTLTLTVSDGTATFNGVTASTLTGLYAGDVVTLTANEPPSGQVFQNWDTDYGSFSSRTAETTTFTMPGRDAHPWVNYKDAIETCSHHDGEIICYAWEGNSPLPSTPGNYFLTQDVTLTSTWEVPAGTTALCLHNHKIIMAGDGPAIHVGNGATLLLLASNQIWDERNTLQHAAGASGCGVQVDGGSFTLEIARILNHDGGGLVVNSGSAKIGYRSHIGNNGNGGTLGGGVIINGGSVVMDDGAKISGNTALLGGGVYLNGGSFTAIYGECFNNTAVFGSGVFVADGSFNIRYWPMIGSVYLASGKKINVTGKLEFTDPITVSMQDRSGVITSGLQNRGSIARFAAADENHQIIEGTGGEAFLLFTPPAFGEPDFILPADITAIGESAFEGNASMAVVYVPGESASIGKDAFKNCSGLLQIRLPKDCTFDGNPFDGCTNLMAIYASEGGYTQTWAQNNGIPFSTAVDQNS